MRLIDLLTYAMWGVIVLIFGLAVFGCGAKDIAVNLLATNPTAKSESAYQAARDDVITAHEVIAAKLAHLSEDDAQVIRRTWDRLAHMSEAVTELLNLNERPAPNIIKDLIDAGTEMYGTIRPVIEENRALFTDEEWAVIVRANKRVQALYKEAQVLYGAGDLIVKAADARGAGYQAQGPR